MTYIIGSTRDDGFYVSGYRVLSDRIAYSQWTQDRSSAATFTKEQRDRLSLPIGGCWVVDDIVTFWRSVEMATVYPTKLGVVTSLPDFDVASESDEVTP